MDDTPTNEEPKKEFNKLDLTQLQSFSFGTQWTQDKTDPSGRSARERDDRPRREGPGAPDAKRDRRGFRRPLGAPPPTGGGQPGAGEPGGQRDRRAGGHGYPARESGPGGPREGGAREGAGRPPYRGPRRDGP